MEDDESKWVYNGSAGWLLFWLLVIPPVGYLLLIFGLRNGKVVLDD